MVFKFFWALMFLKEWKDDMEKGKNVYTARQMMQGMERSLLMHSRQLEIFQHYELQLFRYCRPVYVILLCICLSKLLKTYSCWFTFFEVRMAGLLCCILLCNACNIIVKKQESTKLLNFLHNPI